MQGSWGQPGADALKTPVCWGVGSEKLSGPSG